MAIEPEMQGAGARWAVINDPARDSADIASKAVGVDGFSVRNLEKVVEIEPPFIGRSMKRTLFRFSSRTSEVLRSMLSVACQNHK